MGCLARTRVGFDGCAAVLFGDWVQTYEKSQQNHPAAPWRRDGMLKRPVSQRETGRFELRNRPFGNAICTLLQVIGHQRVAQYDRFAKTFYKKRRPPQLPLYSCGGCCNMPVELSSAPLSCGLRWLSASLSRQMRASAPRHRCRTQSPRQGL